MGNFAENLNLGNRFPGSPHPREEKWHRMGTHTQSGALSLQKHGGVHLCLCKNKGGHMPQAPPLKSAPATLRSYWPTTIKVIM